jgi:MFS family permease
VSHPDVLWPTILAGVFGMFTANLPVTLAAFAKNVFDSGASGYGMLSAIVAVGSLTGALISARRPRARIRTLLVTGGALAVLDVLASLAPNEAVFCVLLAAIGTSTLLLLTATNSTVQLAAHDAIRGRVLGIYLLAFVGGAAIGGPVVGAIVECFGPRAGLLVAGIVSGTAAALVATKIFTGSPRRSPLGAARLMAVLAR